jgi:hypothetical protein
MRKKMNLLSLLPRTNNKKLSFLINNFGGNNAK